MSLGIVVLELTKKCNLKCVYCSVHTIKSKDITIDEWKKILFKLSEENTHTVVLSGGEPLMYGDFEAILELSCKLFRNVGITTNGTLIDEYHASLFKKYKNLTIQVSIDGDETQHDLLRGKNTYSVIIKNIKMLLNNEISVKTMSVLNSDNINQIDNLVKNITDIGINTIGFERLIATGRGSSLTSKTISATDLEKLTKRLIDNNFYDGKVHINDPIVNVMANSNSGKITQYLAVDGCLAGIKNFVVDNSGYLKICTRIPIRIDHMSNITFDSIFSDYDILKKLLIRDLTGKCTDCSNLMYCGGCRADSLVSYGDLFNNDDACWYKCCK